MEPPGAPGGPPAPGLPARGRAEPAGVQAQGSRPSLQKDGGVDRGTEAAGRRGAWLPSFPHTPRGRELGEHPALSPVRWGCRHPSQAGCCGVSPAT